MDVSPLRVLLKGGPARFHICYRVFPYEKDRVNPGCGIGLNSITFGVEPENIMLDAGLLYLIRDVL